MANELTWAQRQSLIRAAVIESAIPGVIEKVEAMPVPETDPVVIEAKAALDRAVALAAAPTELEALQSVKLESEGVVVGSEWRQPTGAHDAYPLGFVVSFNGAQWENITPANVWQPGVSGWREITEGNDWPDWVQPTGGHDAYPAGAQVTYNGNHWISDVDANVWAPGVYGWTQQ